MDPEWVDDHPDDWRAGCDDEWASYEGDTDPDAIDPRWYRENYNG